MNNNTRVFEIGLGAKSLPQLTSRDHLAHARTDFHVNIGIKVQPEDLLDPLFWGDQPLISRGDRVTAFRIDGAFWMELYCENKSGKQPIMREITLVHQQVHAEDAPADVRDRVEYRPATAWTVIIAGEPVATNLDSQKTAQAELEKRLAAEPEKAEA